MKIYSFVLTTSLRELSQVWGSLSVKLHIFASYYNSSLKDAGEKLTNNSDLAVGEGKSGGHGHQEITDPQLRTQLMPESVITGTQR